MATSQEKLDKKLKKAIGNQDAEAVRDLLAQGADPKQDGPSFVWTRAPLEIAYERRNIEIGEILLKAGADPNIKVHEEGCKYPAPSMLSHAIENGVNNFLSLLFEDERTDPEFGGIYDSYRIRRGKDKPMNTKRPPPVEVARAAGRADIVEKLEAMIAAKRECEALQKADKLREEAREFRRQADELTTKAAHCIAEAEELERKHDAARRDAPKRKFKI